MTRTSTELLSLDRVRLPHQVMSRGRKRKSSKHVMINVRFTINFAVWDTGSEAHIWEGYYCPHRATLDVNNDSALSQSVT